MMILFDDIYKASEFASRLSRYLDKPAQECTNVWPHSNGRQFFVVVDISEEDFAYYNLTREVYD